MDEQIEAAQPPETSDSNEPKFAGVGYLVTMIVCLILGLIWVFWGSEIAHTYFVRSSPVWFQKPWFLAPKWAIYGWLFLSTALPVIVLLIIGAFCAVKIEAANRSQVYAANLQDLSKARIALQQGLRSLDKLEREFKTKVASFDKLQKQIDELSSLREVDVAHVQKMLNAMAHASRRETWARRIGLILVGIVTSLLGTFIWNVVAI